MSSAASSARPSPDLAAPEPASGDPLNTYVHGPEDGPVVLALHGVTGHGRRWANLAENHVPEARWIAPDLRGHGHSTYEPPWHIESHVASALAALRERTDRPAVVVGHSFGGALALHLAHDRPDAVRALVLLDPAIGQAPSRMRAVADATIASPDYDDAEQARSEKIHGAWADVAPEILDAEIAEHLVVEPSGRAHWRYSVPALVAAWGELSRDLVVPAEPVPTILVRAARVEPPYVTDALRGALRERLGDHLREVDLDCDHMVPQARPEDVAALVRSVL
ncbi:alpha/beta hydrolase [Rhodococcus rhodnii]|uniref:Esterase n=2 Tax=Rhodococcus rhodnii TaxID=38312 RepID=R7WTH9_9NOCA|nr:alpha/beta hydrolase [Rhodococcus rhodnii]EOM77439.1 esterase [Rhodococcus rhodnii LMG 5362]TXG90614.1 alpha/beta hydrolase [Rhodococcus rhodnii]